MNKSWTPQEDEILCDLHAKGVLRKVIEQRLGRSKSSVARRIRTLRLPPRERVRRLNAHRIYVHLEPDMYADLYREASQRGISVSALTREAIQSGVLASKTNRTQESNTKVIQ